MIERTPDEAASDTGPRRRRSSELVCWNICPKTGSHLYSVREERMEHLLIWLSDGPETLYRNFGQFRAKALRQKLIRNTGRTAGIASTNGGVQWYYELTDKGREVLAAYDAEQAAAAAQVPA